MRYIAVVTALIFSACSHSTPAEKYIIKDNNYYIVTAMRDSLDENGRLWNVADLEYAKDKSHRKVTLTGNPYPGDTVLMGTNAEGQYTVVIHKKE